MAKTALLDRTVYDRERRRDMHVLRADAHVVWRARRVQVDADRRCLCGAPSRVVFERSMVAGQPLPQWVVVAEVCDYGCDPHGS
jgi:hypothetical protein